jgi:hypothetical protein
VRQDLGGDVEGLLRVEAEDLLGRGDLVGTERGAVRRAGVLLVRRGPGDDRLQLDERRAAGLGLGRGERGVDGREVLAVVDPLDVPAVGLVALADVLGEGDVGVVLDRDPVVVVDQDQVAQPLGAGQRRGLAADALLQVAVRGEAPDVVVEQALALGGVGVEQAPLAAGGHRHTDRVAHALAERAGGGLDARGVPVLGVAGGPRAPGAQRLQVLELQAVAGEEELDVEGQAGVAHREHEPVPAQPVRVGGVVPQPFVEQQVGGGRHAHRRPRVAVADLLDGVHREHPDRVDDPAVQLAEALGERRVRLGRVTGGGVARGLGRRLGLGAPGVHPVLLPRRSTRAGGPGPGETVRAPALPAGRAASTRSNPSATPVVAFRDPPWGGEGTGGATRRQASGTDPIR